MTAKEIINDIEQQIEHIKNENEEFMCSCCMSVETDLEVIKARLNKIFDYFKNLINQIIDFEATTNECDAMDITYETDFLINTARELKTKYFPEDEEYDNVFL